MTDLNAIRAASKAFYAALNVIAHGDDTAMKSVWAKDENVTAQHPIGGRDTGYDAIAASFAKVAGIAGGGDIRLEDQAIDVGQDMAIETGVEIGTLIIAGHEAMIHHRVTNVYRHDRGAWKLAHHHTDLSPSMLKILERLSDAA